MADKPTKMAATMIKALSVAIAAVAIVGEGGAHWRSILYFIYSPTRKPGARYAVTGLDFSLQQFAWKTLDR
jgi:hypothetical protein